MENKEKLEVIKMASAIADDLCGLATAIDDDAYKSNMLMAKCEAIEAFGQILRERWNIEEAPSCTSTFETFVRPITERGKCH
jgi:hypothetical protein